jgi:hypothetical protein
VESGLQHGKTTSEAKVLPGQTAIYCGRVNLIDKIVELLRTAILQQIMAIISSYVSVGMDVLTLSLF